MPASIRAAAAVLGSAVLVAACSPSAESPSAQTSSASPSASTSASQTSAPPQPEAGRPKVATPLVASVIAAPIPVPATDGRDHLAYELWLTNPLPTDITVTSLQVLAGDRPLLALSGDKLAYWTRIMGDKGRPATTIGPGLSAVVWLDVVLDRPADGGPAAVPAALVHRLDVSIAKPQPPLLPPTMTETVAPVTVQSRKPAVIAPPLAGPNWLNANSCCDMTPHRMALNPMNGQLWGAERFAIDYLQLGPDGRVFTGDIAKPESYPYFGTDIHAVADGPVVSTRDGLPEQVAGVDPTGLPLDEYGGNHIVQDIGNGNYAFYAHLKTGSVKVKPGDRLTTGQVIGSLGNSGNTTAPHLHFHVMSTPDPLGSDGLPFVFSSFTLDSRLVSQDALEPLLDRGEPAQLQPGFAPRDETGVSPLFLDVMTYPKR